MYATLWKATAALAAAVLAVGLVALATSPSDGATPTCRGHEATHVGEPGQVLKGTMGADVIISNGAKDVYARGGDDVICVTGRRDWASVIAGRGDDLVDASAYRGRTMTGLLRTGNDTYLGSPRRDRVLVSAWGDDSDVNRVSTRRGNDTIRLFSGRARTEALLGRGRDRLIVDSPRQEFRVHGGRGRDQVKVSCRCRSVSLHLARSAYEVPGRRARIPDFEDSVVNGADAASIVGTPTRNRVELRVCHGVVRARAGGDQVIERTTGARCGRPRMTFYGQGGDDVLRALRGPDRLYGGPGTDFANGRAGRDVCRAERKRNCER